MSKDIQNLDNLFGITSGEPKKNKEVNIKKNNDIENLNNIFGINEETSKAVDNKYNTSFEKAQLNLNTDLTNRDYVSEYDDPFNTDNGLTDLNELRANRQSWGSKAATGIGRVGVKVVAEVAKMPGMIGGAIAAPFAEEGEGWDTFVNNSWIKTINQMNEDINSEALPVYVKKAVSEGNLWDNISSIDFWATDGADGIGYIASMMVPGAALKGLGVGKYLSQIRGLKGVLSAQKADVITATVANTLFEAGAEAGNAMENFQKDMDTKLANGEISPEQYEEMKLQKARLGRDIFLSNAVILAGPNALQANMLWGKSINKTMSKLVDGGDGALAKTVVEPKLYQKVLNRTGDVLKATGSEGLWEEGMQMSVENMFTKSAKKGQLTDNPFNDFNISELGDSYLDTISSTEGQKAMFLGAFLGGGMQAYSGAKTDITNRKSTQSLLDTGNNAIDAFYKTMQTDLYNEDGTINSEKAKEKFEAFGRVEQLNIMYNQAVQKQDKEALEKLRDLAATQLAYGFIMNEDLGLEVLQEHLNASSQFDEIVQREQEIGNKTSKKDIIDNVMSKAKTLEKAYRNFNDFAPTLINPTLNENQTQEDVVNFTNTLRGNYISNKANINLNENTLSDLKKKRQNILEDLDLNSELVIGDETIQEQEQNDERLKQVTKDIKEIQTNLDRLKKLDKNFWNTEHIQKAFDRSTKEKKQLEKETSPEVVANNDIVLEQIRNLNSTEELMNFNKNLDDSLKNNPVIVDALEDRGKEVIQENKLKQELQQQEKLNKDKEVFQEDADFGTSTTNTTTVTASETNITNGLETIQTSDNPEVTNNDEIFDESPLNIVTLKENTNPENSDKNQGSARIISTYKETGESIPGLESFVDFEKTPRDKTKDKVTFSLGDITKQKQDKELELIFNKIKKGVAVTQEEITALENYLPIKVILTNGKNSASSFIDSMSHPNPDIVARETLPLRKAIIASLIENKGDFKGIEGKVEKQFSGTLKLGEQNSNILELDVFKGMSQEDMIKYFKKNTVYVSNKGVVKYTATDAIDDTKSLSSKNKGEVFLKIPMINGEIFYLKLNVNRLTDEKARDTFELIKLRSDVLNKKEEFTFEQLEEYIQVYLPSLRTEFDFIKRNTDSIDVTLERLINFIVYSQNTNAKTKLILGQDGTLVLGELLHKVNAQIPEWSGQLESYTYTNETLNNLTEEQEQAIIEYLKYKRHNVLITKDDDFTFNNNDYIKYLLGLNSDYSILSTNAVVNEPTFQGYSNIYLNQSVVNNNKSKSKEIASEEIKSEDINYENPEDLLASLENQYGDDVVQTIQPIAPSEIVVQQTIEHDLIGKEIEAKEPTTKEIIKGKIKSVEVNKIKKGQFRLILDNNEIIAWNESNPNNFTWVKKNNSEPIKIIKSDNLKDIFKNADIKTKSKIVAITAKQLGMMDKVNPKDMESSFNELFKELKDNESLQNEIKKICGI